MSLLIDYSRRIAANTVSREGVDFDIKWDKVALIISAPALLAVIGYLFVSYPLELIILLLFVGSVLFMERK